MQIDIRGDTGHETLDDIPRAVPLPTVAWLEQHFDELVPELWAEIERELPVHAKALRGSGDDDPIARIGGSVLGSFTHGAGLPLDHVFGELEALGFSWASRGVPIDVAANCVRVATGAGFRFLRVRLEGSSDATALASVGELSLHLFGAYDEIVSALRRGYRRFETFDEGAGPRDSAAFVRVLLDGGFAATDGLRQRARALGFALDGLAWVIWVAPAEPAGAAPDVEAVTPLVRDVLPDVLAAPSSMGCPPHCVLLAPAGGASRQRVVDGLGAIGAAHRFLIHAGVVSVEDLHRAYRTSADRLRMMRVAARGAAVVRDEDLEPYRLLATVPIGQAFRFIQATASGLLTQPPDKAEGFVDTLIAVASYREMASVADELCLKVKSVRARLERIEELTGLDFRLPGDRLRLHLAVTLLRLFGEDLPAPGDPAWRTPAGREPFALATGCGAELAGGGVRTSHDRLIRLS